MTLKIIGRGTFLMRLDDTKDMVVQALVAQITVDGIIGLDCLRSNAGLILLLLLLSFHSEQA
jgi:hypothetical protein